MNLKKITKSFLSISYIAIVITLTSCNNNLDDSGSSFQQVTELKTAINQNYEMQEISLAGSIDHINDTMYSDNKIYISVDCVSDERSQVYLNEFDFIDNTQHKYQIPYTGDEEQIAIQNLYVNKENCYLAGYRVFRKDNGKIIEKPVVYNFDLNKKAIKNSFGIESDDDIFINVKASSNKVFCLSLSNHLYVFDNKLEGYESIDLSDTLKKITGNEELSFIEDFIVDDLGNIYLQMLDNETENGKLFIKLNDKFDAVWSVSDKNYNDLPGINMSLGFSEKGKLTISDFDDSYVYVDILNDETAEVTDRIEISKDAVILLGQSDSDYLKIIGNNIEFWNINEDNYKKKYEFDSTLEDYVYDSWFYNERMYRIDTESDDDNAGTFVKEYDLNGNELSSFKNAGLCDLHIATDGTIYEINNENIVESKSGNNRFSVDCNSVILSAKDVFVVYSSENDEIQIFSSDGNMLASGIEYPDNCKFITSQSSEKLFFYNVNSKELCVYNTKAKNITNHDLINSLTKDDKYTYMYDSGGIYDFYIIASNKCYGYNADNDSVTLLVDSMLNIGLNNIREITCLDENGKLLAITENEAYILTPSDNNVDKAELKIAYIGDGISNSNDFQEGLKQYREINSNLKLNISQYADSSTLDLELVKGNIPDIIICDAIDSLSKYYSKDMFADLSELSKEEEYLSNIISMYKNDNKIIAVCPSFKIGIIAGNTILDGNYNISEFFDSISEYGDEAIFWYKSKSELLSKFLPSYSSEYIDYQNRKCDFDNNTFLKLITTINSQKSCDKWEKEYMFTCFANEMAKLSIYETGSFNFEMNFIDQKDNKIELYGFPGENVNNIEIIPDKVFSIVKESDKQSEAKELIRYLLNEDMQKKVIENSFPVNRKVYYDKLEQDQKNSGTNHSGDNKIDNLIQKADSYYRVDESIKTIVLETAEEYFSGSISAEECAKAIQNKASLYLDERY